MMYTDTVERSGEYLRMVLNHMGRHSIPLDPMNYTVWYEYVSGKNQPLTEAINDHIQASKPFTPELNIELYRRYIEDANKTLIDDIRNDIKTILKQILQHVVQTGDEISRSGDNLETYLDNLTRDNSAQTIHEILTEIVRETRAIESKGSRLKDQLIQTTQEVEILRRDLERFRRQASTDPLTGLSNRRAFEEALTQEVHLASDTDRALCLLMADLDHFKRVNDSFGHLIGDKVLKMAGDMIKNCVRGRDVVARWGGEEFVVMLPETPLQGAITVAQTICTYFQEKQWKRTDTGESMGQITLSLGVALYQPGEAPASLIRRADRAMYTSKHLGRNRVSSEDDIDTRAVLS